MHILASSFLHLKVINEKSLYLTREGNASDFVDYIKDLLRKEIKNSRTIFFHTLETDDVHQVSDFWQCCTTKSD